jgi:hypothetical protein
MSVTYIIIAVAFIPLFIVCLSVTKRAYPDLYDVYGCKVISAFFVFVVIVGFRLAVYMLISRMKYYDPREMHYEIPFFVSEILICAIYC